MHYANKLLMLNTQNKLQAY